MAARTATVASTGSRARKKKNPVFKWIKRIILLTLTLFSLGFIVLAAVFMSVYKEQEQRISNLPALIASIQQEPTEILSADGKPLFIISSEYRRPAQSAEIPKVVKDAVVAAEDVRFYKHHGVDIPSLFRIAVEAMKDRHFSQGGSTLTMQLAKRLYTSPEKTLKRKMQDMALAVAMERQLTKDQILTLYLNDVFFGSGAYGIRAAAQVYLGKELNELDASDAALLVRCVRRPSDETPFANYKKSIENRDTVLKIMHDEGMINDSVYNHSIREKPHLNPNPPSTTARVFAAPYFVDHVRKLIAQDMPDIDINQGGYKIYTTLDSHLQQVAEEATRKTIEQSRKKKVTTGACILIDYKGRILAEVGGVDYKKDQYNVITDGRRQPGSSFKSILYSTAMDQGQIDEDSYVSDDLKTYVDQWGNAWTPHNDDDRRGGSYPVHTAFALSLNVCAAHIMEKVTPAVVVDYANNKFGFPEHFQPLMSLALGTGEVAPIDMARAYSIFMTGGDRVEPYPIDRVVGPDGTVLRKYEPKVTANVLDPRVVNQMRDLQLDVVQHGTGMVARAVPNARGKTGTTSDNKDAWFCGYSDGLECICWVANEGKKDGKPYYDSMSSKVFGGTTATLIWVPVMNEAHKRYAVSMPDRDVVDTNAAFATQKDVDQTKAPTDTEKDHVNDMVAPNNTPTKAPDDGDINNSTDNPPMDAGDQPDSLPPVPPIQPIKPKPKPKPIEYITVEVCADSHELATMYCPETVMRTYVKGQEPHKYCHIHGPGQ